MAWPTNRIVAAALALTGLLIAVAPLRAASVLVEAESFDRPGGWSLDTQSIVGMGSPYLLAHGLGKPVDDASTTVKFAKPGTYHIYVRTKDWVARWQAPGQPGKFQLLVDGVALKPIFGTAGADWFWQAGGEVDVKSTATLTLHDLTGFEGRCDAVWFTQGDERPPNDRKTLDAWRRKQLALPEQLAVKKGYDLVVVGGGYSGLGAAISAARMGCKVALIQDRSVLGGNGSSEVRVWAMGEIKRGKYPHIGEIVEEFADHATKSPGTAEMFGDEKKSNVVVAEKNIDLFLNYHVFRLETNNKQIQSVDALDTRTSEQTRFVGRFFCDATGHGAVGAMADADFEMKADGRMGMSNMWTWAEEKQPTKFPETPWALDLNMKDFPYPKDFHAEWFWEGGFNKDAINDAEGIRDWNLRAIYGAFNAMKNRDGADKHRNAALTWVAYIGGPRESRRLLGDVLLTQQDVVGKRDFPDGCVPSTWSIDLHVPKKQYAEKFPDNPFISIAQFDSRVDRTYGYPIPYRCFYSRNVDNLFMAGRCISVSHEALGTIRVMKTCGMMGEVVGKATSVCIVHGCDSRDVYEKYWNDLDELLRLPGKARRATTADPLSEQPSPPNKEPVAGANAKKETAQTGIDPQTLPGLVIDDVAAQHTGKWTAGVGLPGYVGQGYVYAPADSDASIRYEFQSPGAGKFEIRMSYGQHENRGRTVPVVVQTAAKKAILAINMREKPPLDNGFISLGVFDLTQGETVAVTIATKGAGGNVHADAIQILPAEKK